MAQRIRFDSEADRPPEKRAQATRAALEAQEQRLRLLEAQVSAGVPFAPCDGIVAEILRHSGETMKTGQPILTNKAGVATRVTAYLREPLSTAWAPGAAVQLRSRDEHRTTAPAQGVSVGDQFEPVPAGMASARADAIHPEITPVHPKSCKKGVTDMCQYRHVTCKE